VQTVTSGQSIQEYFEMKMREMKARREGKEMRGDRCIRLARGKFELTNHDSTGGKNFGVLM